MFPTDEGTGTGRAFRKLIWFESLTGLSLVFGRIGYLALIGHPKAQGK